MPRLVLTTVVAVLLGAGCAGSMTDHGTVDGTGTAADASSSGGGTTGPPAAGPSASMTIGTEQPPAPPRPARLGDGSTWTLTRLWDEAGDSRPPAAAPPPSFTIDGGVDPVGDGGGQILVRTGCGEFAGLLHVDAYAMTVAEGLDDTDLDSCPVAAAGDARALLAALEGPLTIAVEDTTLTLTDAEGRPRLAFTSPRPDPFPTPPVVTVPADWACERIEIAPDDRDPVGGHRTASLNLEAALPAALRVDALAIEFDGRAVGRIEVEEVGPRRTIAVTAYEYCLPPSVDPSPAGRDHAPYGDWVLTEDGGTDQPPDTTTTLDLRPESANGSTACNDYHARTDADVQGRFRVNRLSRNEAGCGAPYGSAEQRFADAFASVHRWELTDDGRLLLHGPDVTLGFSRRD